MSIQIMKHMLEIKCMRLILNSGAAIETKQEPGYLESMFNSFLCIFKHLCFSKTLCSHSSLPVLHNYPSNELNLCCKLIISRH